MLDRLRHCLETGEKARPSHLKAVMVLAGLKKQGKSQDGGWENNGGGTERKQE